MDNVMITPNRTGLGYLSSGYASTSTGYKRPYNVAFTTDTRGGEDRNAGAAAQYNKVAVKWGRKRPIRSLLNKLEKRNTSMIIRRFGRTQPFTSLVGGFKLGYEEATGGLAKWLPMYVLDLTSQEVIDTTSGYTNVTVPSLRRAQIVGATGAISFIDTQGDGNNGTTPVSQFQPIKVVGNTFGSTASSILNRGYNAGVLEWVNLKLLFKSPTDRPGWYKVSIVQFVDEDPLPGQGTSAHNAFWEKRAKALLYNPISHEVTGAYGGREWSGCKVLQQKVIRFNPDTNTNLANYGGEQHRYDLFLRLNRFVNQREKEGQALRTDVLNTDMYCEEGVAGNVGGETDIRVYNTAAEPKARVFAVIEATYWDNAVVLGTADADYKKVAASFDMEVRTKWVYKQPYA